MASEIVTQTDNEIYIQMSKMSIDTFICENNYKKAFLLLIMVIERLDNDEKIEFIGYYSKKLYEINDISHLDIRNQRLKCKKV